MKGVMSRVPDALLAHRRKTGEDRWDEMWNGVLHMTPAPSVEHQRIVGKLFTFLSAAMERTGRGQILLGINVCDAPAGWENYRVPDVTFVAAGRDAVVAPDGVRFGAPDVVIEVRSPDDETYEKLPFFAALGVREVIVIDRDTRQVELFVLDDTEYVSVHTDPDGWRTSAALGVRFRPSGEIGKVRVEDLAEPGRGPDI